ncbi:hypothetical protein BFRIPC_00014 (plasmid) [Peribacillus frigoritolerans]
MGEVFTLGFYIILLVIHDNPISSIGLYNWIKVKRSEVTLQKYEEVFV